jgi:hypothetical protein
MNDTNATSESERTLELPASPSPPHAACEHCGAALDERQRYCVACGGRRSDAYNPAVRYFADTAQARRRDGSSGEPRPDPGAPRVAAALVLAILPLAVGIGVLIGRDNGSSVDPRLLAALRAQPAQVVASGPTGASGSTAAAAPAATATRTGGKVLARNSFGAAHQIAGFSPSAAQRQRDAQVVNRINHDVGKSYVNAQRNLPDAIVVGGNGGGGGSGGGGPSQGPGQP